MKEHFGKYCLDVSKLVLGSAVIAGVMKQDIPLSRIIFFGTIAVILFAIAGLLFIKNKK